MSTCLLITTIDRSRQLEASFERLAGLTPPDEILVIDDGGSDDCEGLCQRFSARYLYNHNPGPSICSLARNVGLRHTAAEIVITSEPEIMFITDVIAQLLAAHEQHPTDVISAGTVFHARADGVREPENCERIEGWVAPFTALYRRDWLLEIGGWDESFPGAWGWDDTDLLTRLRASGHGQVIDREIEVLHQWHAPTGADQAPNQEHFFAKSFHRGDVDTDRIANKEREWGVLRRR